MPPKMQERRKYLSAGGKHDEKTAPKRGGRGVFAGAGDPGWEQVPPRFGCKRAPLRPEVDAFTPENCREAERMSFGTDLPLALGRHGTGVGMRAIRESPLRGK
jgi:hypothetical protein